jgi:hypothetical protein
MAAAGLAGAGARVLQSGCAWAQWPNALVHTGAKLAVQSAGEMERHVMSTGTLWGMAAILLASSVAAVLVWCAAVLAKRADQGRGE